MTTCTERVSRGYEVHSCGKPTKGGTDLCGVHLSARRKREAAEAARAAERATSDQNQKRAQALCDDLAVYGIDARPYYGPITARRPSYTGGIVVDDPEKLLDRLGTCEHDYAHD